MSWLPITPQSLPRNLAHLARINAAILGSREAANLLLNIGNEIPQRAALAKGHVTRTKTKMKKQFKKNYKKDTLVTKRAVQRMLRGSLEKKQRLISASAGAMVKDAILTLACSLMSNANTDGGRVGDVINLQRLQLNITYQTMKTAAFYRCRIIVFWSGEEYNSAWAVGITASELLISGGSENVTSATNPKAVTVLYDQMIDINSQLNDYEDGQTVRVNVPLGNTKFAYQSAGSVYGKTKNLYAVAIPSWTSTNTTTPTNAGTLICNGALFYTDA